MNRQQRQQIGRSYKELDDFLGGRISRNIGVATVLYRYCGNIRLRYHSTDIVSFTPDGNVYLDNGGWSTTTTKSRLNDVLPRGYSVFQKNYAWYLDTPEGIVPFERGMTIR